MEAHHSQKKGRLSNSDKSDTVVNDDNLKAKFLRGLLANSLQLVFGHFAMRFVLDSFNLASIFQSSDHTPEIDHCARISEVALRHL
jgi:hypothetical protein